MDVIGTSGDDTLEGSAGDDKLYGQDGQDLLLGNEGNDYLSGGEESFSDHRDTIYGHAGNDTLYGGAASDLLDGGDGDDVIEGGSGDDFIDPQGGNNLVRAGDGDDYISIIRGRDTVYGGAGNDSFSFTWDPGIGQLILDGGDGDDLFYTQWGSKSEGTSMRLTGGAGRDMFYLNGYSDPDWENIFPLPLTITDFTRGSDQLNVYFAQVYDFPGNPFGELGYLRLEQRGADTIIQYDRDGAAGTKHTWYDGAILQGITATDLDRRDFVGYLDPGGSSAGAYEFGTADADHFTGGPLHDSFSGGDGADLIAGGNGNDLLIGGDETGVHAWGGDDLIAGHGNDTLRGGTGNDNLYAGYGNDTLEGGEGDDKLFGDWGDDLISGGDGHDELEDGGGNDTFLGGAGDDRINSLNESAGYFDGGDGSDFISTSAGADTILGGAGDDHISAGNGYVYPETVVTAVAQIDGGDGVDMIQLFYTGTERVVAKGGTGVDTFVPYSIFSAVAEIGDFVPGLGGDVIDFSSWDPTWLQYQLNPFGESGYARAVQVQGDTVIELDRDGALGTGYQFKPVFVLRGVLATDLTIENFTGAASRTAPPGVQLAGDGDADLLTGTGSVDMIEGKDGNDHLDGGADNDRLDGGNGNDTLAGGRGDDTLAGGSGVDRAVFDGAFSAFTITPSSVTDTRGLGTDSLSGIERLVFDDAHYAFDIEGMAGQAYRLYQAAFNRTPDLAGLGYWIGAGDRGLPLVDMSEMFYRSQEFQSLYGASTSNEELVRLFYVNALHRAPDEPGVAYWTRLLDEGLATPAMILTGFSESAENKQATGVAIGDGFKFDPTYY